ncbi:MAG: carboxypeptidase-like regulatory domain-containing protein [Proteobacteria bacterium]|nr:carboxypeptidase-like regulatory domain-containing protein [Pseudomonadota bacterium]
MDALRTLARPPQSRTVRARTLDEKQMLAVFRRELPAMADQRIRVSRCRIRPAAAGGGIHGGRRRIVYSVTVEAQGGSSWDHIIVGTTPVSSDFLSPEILHLCRAAEANPAARPFTRLAAYVDDLDMALLLLPVDPALPGLAEITGGERGRLLAPHIRECADGAIIRQADWTVHRYIPARRCELALDVHTVAGSHMLKRRIRVDVFSDDADEGRIFEGTTTADARGNWTLVLVDAVTGPFVTATATDADGNTSEFSGPLSVTSSGGTITGTVTDSSTNSPIQGATVSTSTGQSDSTNASGEYTLNAVPAENPTVTASASSTTP